MPTDDLLLLVTRETKFFNERPVVVVVVLADGLISLRNNTELVVLDTVMRSHENVGGNKGGDEWNEEEKTVEDGADGEVTSRLERPTHCRVVHDQGPSEVRFRRGGHIGEVNSQGVRRKSVENAITVGITIEVVLEDVKLNGRRPPIHDFQLPLSVAILLRCRRNVSIESEAVEFSSSHETGNPTGYAVLEVGVHDGSGRTHGGCPVWKAIHVVSVHSVIKTGEPAYSS